MKKFLGFICLLYSAIIAYVWFSGSLSNFLAPTLSLYIKISLLPLLIIGLVLLINNNLHCNFKWTDLILILPLVMIFLAGDGRLTSSIATNRMFTAPATPAKEEIIKEEEKPDESKTIIEETLNDDKQEYDFTNVDFDIIDESYEYLAGYMNSKEDAFKQVGKTIRVRGFIVKNDYMGEDYFAIGKYNISCCAADATFAGFISKYNNSLVKADSWYEIEGILQKGKTKDNIDMMYIEVINIKEIDKTKEEQYIYPCYTYDDSCSVIMQYKLY